ncbi:hypothetical protein H9Q10_02125 [Eikenella sp. S3360]|uniref:Uncharacterized protein n=1 Tax=Eikenella glucosivorans TaxID=2766967 RepID=A0ABS0N841_9NEIS|nr:hypothetical protein [Eikenella glucosivorans]MBH5328470.1 hypothetical protein [Eikenella glucosivorans]
MQKKFVYLLYEAQGFRPLEHWAANQEHGALSSYPVETVKGDIDTHFSGIRAVKAGAVVYYGAWLVLIAVTTGYHLYVFFHSPA